MRSTVQPRDQIFVKGYGFLSLLNILVKKLVKTSAANIVRNFLIMLNNLLQMHLKLLQKK